jgi:VanZ family protein
MIKKVYAWIPLILWGSIIFKLSNGSVPVASQVYWQDYVFKKSAHMFFFGVFAVLSYRALRIEGVNRKTAAISAIVMVTLYGASDEIHQSFTQVREARIRDVGFDTLGGSMGILFVYFIFPLLPNSFLRIIKNFNLD